MTRKKPLVSRPCCTTGRWAIWTAIRELQSFTRGALCMRVPKVKEAAVRGYLAALKKGGYLKFDPESGRVIGKARTYVLIRDIGVEAPRLRRDGTELPPTAQQRMWERMYILGSFTAPELAASATLDDAPVAESTSRAYLHHLAKAGYVCALGKKDREPLYRLTKNTGGMSPVIRLTKVVFDPNLNCITWHEEIEP